MNININSHYPLCSGLVFHDTQISANSSIYRTRTYLIREHAEKTGSVQNLRTTPLCIHGTPPSCEPQQGQRPSLRPIKCASHFWEEETGGNIWKPKREDEQTNSSHNLPCPAFVQLQATIWTFTPTFLFSIEDSNTFRHVDLLILDPFPRWTKTEATSHCRTIGRLRKGGLQNRSKTGL